MIRAELLEDGEVTEAIAASPEGRLAGELIEYVENMIAIGTGLIAVYS